MARKNRLFRGGLLAVILLYSVGAVADTALVTIKVTVVAPPPCTINGDQVINVDFGSDVVTSRVDGVNYLKTVDYSLECKNHTRNAMKMKLQGHATAFDRSALQTNMTDLGIALKANGSALTVNDWINFTYPEKPSLQAVPVKMAGVTLAGGDFSAGATLMVNYQ